MAWIERRVTRTSQPQELVGVDWSNPLLRGVTSFIHLGQHLIPQGAEVGSYLPDMLTGRDGKYPSPATKGLWAHTENSPAATFVCVLEATPLVTVSTLRTPYIAWARSQYVNEYLSGIITQPWMDSRTLRFEIRRANYQGVLGLEILNTDAGKLAVAVGRYEKNSVYDFQVNTTLVTGAAGTEPIDAAFYNQISFGAGNPLLKGGIYAALVFNRAITDTERQSLIDNPWQIFEPITEYVWADDFIDAGPPTGPTYTLTATGTALTFTGQQASLSANRVLQATPASIAFTGQTAGLYARRTLYATPAAITLTGQAVDLTYSGSVGPTYTLTATAASLAFTGQSAALSHHRVLSAQPAALAFTGQAVELTYTAILGPTYTLTALPGSFALSSATVGLTATRVLSAQPASFSFAGQSVRLAWSGEPTAVYVPSVYQAYVALPRNQAYVALPRNQAFLN